MSLLDDIKVILRISSKVYDSEVEMLISAAKADMLRVGIRDELVESDVPLVKQAISLFCKAHFGYDNKEATRFFESYQQVLISLGNSTANEVLYGDMKTYANMDPDTNEASHVSITDTSYEGLPDTSLPVSVSAETTVGVEDEV